jgi:hypothetical protein
VNQAYNTTLYIMVGILLIGLACNLFIRPVAAKHHFKEPSAAAPAPAN